MLVAKCAQDQLSRLTSILILSKSETAAGTTTRYTLMRSVPRILHQGPELPISNALSWKRHDQRKHDIQLSVVTYPASLRTTDLVPDPIDHRRPSRLKVWTPTKSGRAMPEAHHSIIAALMPTLLPAMPLLPILIKPILSQVPYPEPATNSPLWLPPFPNRYSWTYDLLFCTSWASWSVKS